MLKVGLFNNELIRLHEVTYRLMDAIFKGFNDNNYLIEKMLEQSQHRTSRTYELIEIYLRECNEDNEPDDEEKEEGEDDEEEKDDPCFKLVG